MNEYPISMENELNIYIEECQDIVQDCGKKGRTKKKSIEFRQSKEFFSLFS